MDLKRNNTREDRSPELPAKRPDAMPIVLSIGRVKQHDEAGSMRRCVERLLMAGADMIHVPVPADGLLAVGWALKIFDPRSKTGIKVSAKHMRALLQLAEFDNKEYRLAELNNKECQTNTLAWLGAR